MICSRGNKKAITGTALDWLMSKWKDVYMAFAGDSMQR
jgi:hypothetical protein